MRVSKISRNMGEKNSQPYQLKDRKT